MRGLDLRLLRFFSAAVLLLAAAPIASEGPPRPVRTEPAWGEIAERLPELFQLSAFDPNLAASLIPAEWVDLLVEATLAAAEEETTVPAEPDAPHHGRLGPWVDTRAFARTIEATDPVAVASLLSALRPAIGLRCQARGRRIGDFDRALRVAAARVTADAPIERASSGGPVSLTPSQREFARLGVPTVLVVQKQVAAIGSALWGSDWKSDSAP